MQRQRIGDILQTALVAGSICGVGTIAVINWKIKQLENNKPPIESPETPSIYQETDSDRRARATRESPMDVQFRSGFGADLGTVRSMQHHRNTHVIEFFRQIISPAHDVGITQDEYQFTGGGDQGFVRYTEGLSPIKKYVLAEALSELDGLQNRHNFISNDVISALERFVDEHGPLSHQDYTYYFFSTKLIPTIEGYLQESRDATNMDYIDIDVPEDGD